MNCEQAIEKASAFITQAGYQHGKCLSSVQSSHYAKETWEVEFAYEGLEERSLTTDPPSIVVAVESEEGEVRLVSLM